MRHNWFFAAVVMTSFPFWHFCPPVAHEYGWPSGGNVESDVTFQLLLDEASGSLFDEVGSLEIPAVGTPGYGQTIADPAYALDPGVLFSQGNYFGIEGEPEALTPHTSDFTLEAWISGAGIFGNPNGAVPFTTGDSFDGYGFELVEIGGVKKARFHVYMAGTGYTVEATGQDALADGLPHHLRGAVTRSGMARFYIDNGEVGTPIDVSILAAYNMGIQAVWVGNASGGRDFPGSVWEVRFSKNATNNSY